MNIGYKRVSTKEQSTARQLDGIQLDRVYEDHVSGATKDRPQLKVCLDVLREGDILYIHSVDRLSRSVRDLIEIVEQVVKSGAKIQLVKEGMSLSGHKDDMFAMCMVHVMTAFAQLERAMSKERQREGIAISKERGTKSGKPFGKQPLDYNRRPEAIEYSKQGNNISQIALLMKLSRASIYKLLS
jgi:DNA invertase Pin-like site-specific DNA recombinase